MSYEVVHANIPCIFISHHSQSNATCSLELSRYQKETLDSPGCGQHEQPVHPSLADPIFRRQMFQLTMYAREKQTLNRAGDMAPWVAPIIFSV